MRLVHQICTRCVSSLNPEGDNDRCRYVTPGAIDAHHSSVEGEGVRTRVAACEVAAVKAVVRDRWSNEHTSQPGNLLGVIVGGSATTQETIMVL